MIRAHWLSLLACVFGLGLCYPAPSVAQGLGVLSAGDGAVDVVERDQIEQRARGSFKRYVELVLENLPEADKRKDMDERVNRVVENFNATLSSRLYELEGDGILSASEVQDEIGALRGDYEEELQTVLTAMQRGYAPPPLGRDYESGFKYVYALVRYTLNVRNDASDWLKFVGTLLLGLVVAWFANAVFNSIAERFTRRDLASVGDIFRSLSGPLYLASLSVFLHLGLNWLWTPSTAASVLQSLVNLMLSGSVFMLLWNACPGLARALVRFARKNYRDAVDVHAQNIAERALRVLVLGALALFVIKIILDTSLTNMLAGLGVLGVGLYLLLRGTLQNIAASLTIYGDEPFRVGDMVVHDGQWGTIEDIGFRSTRFRTFDGHVVTIPNSGLIDKDIENAGARPSIRRRFRIGIQYETPPDKVREAIAIVQSILEDHEGMPDDQPPRVVLESFGSYDLQLLIQYYYAPPSYWEALEFDTEVNIAILEQFGQAGIEFAYPTQTHILAGDEHGQPPKMEIIQRGSDNESESPSVESSSAESSRSGSSSSESSKPEA